MLHFAVTRVPSQFVSVFVSFSVVGLDIQDEMGRHEVGHIENSMKIPLNQGGGCRFEGEFNINKVGALPPVCSVDGDHVASVWVASSVLQSPAVVSQWDPGLVGFSLSHLRAARQIFQDVSND